mmetsp:Transcript_8362/g.9722  ORF Transcript_8362/g.9722 Transcript_8362/m.9722 type:complete len:175 (-) Transcript_8362:709-1233(-)|eukprot:CAMPEP_0197857390 /NCGR_PEP_ID=MMETSP1438-20131217/30386_1 /TAXON_ID=1461541 /ORGANISM="Pterosperma sp., Strain CCMP1384" /LENGTH=174 /DNA_ID=CAMNT_0043473201 /DNA_START=260 /DNA_END=784 /DNA_ORIENTATION=+
MDPSIALKRHLADKGTTILVDTTRLAKQLKSRTHAEELARLPGKFSDRQTSIAATNKMLYQLPRLLAEMDENITNCSFRLEQAVPVTKANLTTPFDELDALSLYSQTSPTTTPTHRHHTSSSPSSSNSPHTADLKGEHLGGRVHHRRDSDTVESFSPKSAPGKSNFDLLYGDRK